MIFINQTTVAQIGVILLLFFIGVLLNRFSPKKINAFYGYRTQLSIKNQATWDEGNKYSSKLMMLFSLLFLVIEVSAIAFLGTKSAVLIPFFLVTLIVISIIIIVKTERHLQSFIKENDSQRINYDEIK